MRHLGEGTQVQTQDCLVSYLPFPHSLKVISRASSSNFGHETKFYGVEFSNCGIMSMITESRVREHFRFQIFRLGLPYL